MSTAAVNTYRGKIDRGTMTLAQIDAAERGRLVTAAEATTLRSYWHSVYDVAGLAVAAAEDRSQTVTWTAPALSTHSLTLVRTAGGASSTIVVPSIAGTARFPADLGEDETAVTITATSTANANGYQGPEATASTTVPAAPAPEPTPEPDPAAAEPEAPAAEAEAPASEETSA